MQEPTKFNFQNLKFKAKTSLKQCKALNRELAKVEAVPSRRKRLADAKPTAEGTTFQEAFRQARRESELH